MLALKCSMFDSSSSRSRRAACSSCSSSAIRVSAASCISLLTTEEAVCVCQGRNR